MSNDWIRYRMELSVRKELEETKRKLGKAKKKNRKLKKLLNEAYNGQRKTDPSGE